MFGIASTFELEPREMTRHCQAFPGTVDIDVKDSTRERRESGRSGRDPAPLSLEVEIDGSWP